MISPELVIPRTNTRNSNLSHNDTRVAAVIFLSSAAAATFDRAGQSRLSTTSSLLLFFLMTLSVFDKLDILFSYSFTCGSYPASSTTHLHKHTYTFLYALLRTDTTTDKGVIFCAILFLLLHTLLCCLDKLILLYRGIIKIHYYTFSQNSLRLFNAAAQSSPLGRFYQTHSLACNQPPFTKGRKIAMKTCLLRTEKNLSAKK